MGRKKFPKPEDVTAQPLQSLQKREDGEDRQGSVLFHLLTQPPCGMDTVTEKEWRRTGL